MSFHLFPFLPLDLRVQIWEIALRSAAMSVVSLSLGIMCPSKIGLSCASETIRQAGSYRIALSCKEAFSEWERTTSLISEWASVRLCLSRTIFLLLDLAQLKSDSGSETFLFTDKISHIKHAAFFAESGMNLLEVMTVLARLNHLETIFIIVPGCLIENTAPIDRRKIQSTAQFLASLTQEPQPGAVSTTNRPVGLHLKGHSPESEVEAFYTGVDAPSVNLVMSQCSKDCRHDQSPTRGPMGYSLFDCT
ncbi:hypothetical protein FoTM2_017764 [Fusarium oxysporum f. sp. vasinfectum]|uniref:2EXR domain-containing protein n=1 Tax=Fusarium oxysporum f. sp. vasinfectum 25433 TaxID=1089449 RepID=X0KWH5_FUSOX|nr:hypothetical protein FOTG_18495 [Fusarium oxysporum f. sp. vasinfectum 25433]KAK2922408.1 hypothetical protein FoTM2_017764 [Fusarium oxysporum f. sp. vasinfectum]